jgi:aryl-alcohol dehydrogenase-like predicted oxidoreductase
VIDVLTGIARNHGTSVAAVALGWLLTRPSVSSILIGASKLSQLTDNLRAVELSLSPEELAVLDSLTAPDPQYRRHLSDVGMTARGVVAAYRNRQHRRCVR